MSEQDYQKCRFLKLCYEGCQASEAAEKQRLLRQIEALEQKGKSKRQKKSVLSRVFWGIRRDFQVAFCQ